MEIDFLSARLLRPGNDGSGHYTGSGLVALRRTSKEGSHEYLG